jgi:hypothetical protein
MLVGCKRATGGIIAVPRRKRHDRALRSANPIASHTLGILRLRRFPVGISSVTTTPWWAVLTRLTSGAALLARCLSQRAFVGCRDRPREFAETLVEVGMP